MTRLLEATERQLDSPARAVAIDKDLASADAFGDTVLACAILCPDPGNETELRAVGKPDRLFLGIERKEREHRSEHLFLRDRGLRIDRSEQHRLMVVAARRRTRADCTLCQYRNACF